MAFGHFVLPNAYQLGIKHINNNYLVIKKWISYLQKGINPKTNHEIDQFYNLLNQNNLIITNENYKYLFKNKKVFIIGIDKDNTELKHLIEKLEINQSQISYITTDDLFPEIKVPVTKYSLISLEVKDALYKIIDLIQKIPEMNDLILQGAIATFIKDYSNILPEYVKNNSEQMLNALKDAINLSPQELHHKRLINLKRYITFESTEI